MKLQTVFGACKIVIKELHNELSKQGIKGTLITPSNEEATTLKDLYVELDNLENWCYKGKFEVQQVVRCKNCKYYKRYKKKLKDNRYDHKIIAACSKDKIQRHPEFFCANGEEREV